MNRCDLEPQLQGILSRLRELQDPDNVGDSINDFIKGGGLISELTSADQKMYAVELGLMDLILQVQTEPDRLRLHWDGNDTWCEVSLSSDMANTLPGQYGNVDQAVEAIEALPDSMKRNHSFVIRKLRGGEYEEVHNVGMYAVAMPEEKSE